MSRGHKSNGHQRPAPLRPATPLVSSTSKKPSTHRPGDPLEELKSIRAEANARRAELEALDHRAGALVLQLIESKAYSYAELASALGVSRQALQKSAGRQKRPS